MKNNHQSNHTDITFDIPNDCGYTLLYFHATWCSTCHTMQSIIHRVRERHSPTIDFISIDIEQQPMAAAIFRIRSVPTYILWSSGSELWRHSGLLTTHELEDRLNSMG